jgi:hypothetical protein
LAGARATSSGAAAAGRTSVDHDRTAVVIHHAPSDAELVISTVGQEVDDGLRLRAGTEVAKAPAKREGRDGRHPTHEVATGDAFRIGCPSLGQAIDGISGSTSSGRRQL